MAAVTAPSDNASSIQVVVRVRPFTIREAAQLARVDDGPLFLGDGSLAAVPVPKLGQKGLRSVIKVVDDKCLVFDPPEDNPVQRFSRSVVPQGKRVKDQTFGFDRVFDDNATQNDIYDATTRTLLDSVLDGYNATVFAYGATGCGKTHTITGTAQSPGIIFMTMQELFEKVDELQETKESEITLSYLEIYNETIRDLLNPGVGAKQGLMLREDANQAVSVAGLSSHKPQNVQEVMDMVIRGNAMRTQSPTEANATSSRSHAVLQINVSLKLRDANVHEPVTMATLSIIDLAGSERASATKNRGERLLEGANINKSLLALGSCINALCDPRKKNHVPYRNSKLTRLLKFSLGGNCRTVMIVCVSPSSQHFDETQNTLRYANRAKNIQTKSVRNVYNVDRHVKDYLKKIDEQMARINELTAQQKQYEELAFVKFRKAESKRTEIAHEGVRRIRAAWDHSAEERKERMTQVKRLRQIERRIGAISGWIGAFDQVCESREGEEPPVSLTAMRKTAQGILVELEGSRQHYHMKIAKNNWTRAIDTALSDGLRQLHHLDGYVVDSAEEANLQQEVEVLKNRAEIDTHLAVLEQEKSAEAGLMQVMLTAHFETIAILNQILLMSEEEAVQAAREILGKLLQSSNEATSQVIKPDGGLQITQAVPPTRNGTPRKRKQIPLIGPSPLKNKIRSAVPAASSIPAHMAPEMDPSPQLRSTPVRGVTGSPRRRIKVAGARKGITFTNGSTPRKRSPSKKRAVRWRDEDDSAGELVEYQATPKISDSSPPAPSEAIPNPLDHAHPSIDVENPWTEPDSSPLPTAPASSHELRKPTSSRFATGFLTKKNDTSPTPAAPSLSPGTFSSSDEATPLREIEVNRTSLLPRRSLSSSPLPPPSSAQFNQNISPSLSSDDKPLSASPGEIVSAMRQRRRSSLGHGGTGSGGGGGGGSRVSSSGVSRRESAHRRRSPTASSTIIPSTSSTSSASSGNAGGGMSAISPSSSNSSSVTAAVIPGTDAAIFSASHARRMVRSEREDALRSVLSPRTQAIIKASGPVAVRRSMADVSSAAPSMSAPLRPVQVRNSSVVAGGSGMRVSSGSKAAWR